MRAIVVGVAVLAAAVPAAATEDLDRWHRRADLVIRAEVVQVSAEGDAVTVVLDRALRGDRPPLALTFAPAPGDAAPDAEAPEGADPEAGARAEASAWRVGDRAVLFLRHRIDPGDGPRWDSLATHERSPAAADPLAAAALDRYFAAEPAGGDRAVREARAVQALGSASPALARHGARSLEVLAVEGPLAPETVAAIAAAARDPSPLRRLGAVTPLRGLACAGDDGAVALLGRLANDEDVEVVAVARQALANRCGDGPEEAGGGRLAVLAGGLVGLGLLAGGLALARVRRAGAGPPG